MMAKRVKNTCGASKIPADTKQQKVALSKWFLLVAAVVLVFSVIAVYSAIGDYPYAGSDPLSALLATRDFFAQDNYYTGWSQAVAPFLFPDYLIFWLGYLIDAGTFTYWFYMTSIVVVATVGWMLLADKIFNRAITARVFTLLAVALHCLVMAYDGEGALSVALFSPFHHNGAWAIFPYLLRLFVDISESPKPDWRLALFALLLGLMLFSDMLIIVWFVAPAAAILLFAFFAAPARFRCWKHLLAALFVAYIIRHLFIAVWPATISPNTERFTSFNPEVSLTTASQLLSTLGEFALFYPFLFVCWLVFFVLSGVVLAPEIRALLASGGRRAKKIRNRRDMDNATVIAVFFALSALAAPAAAIATGSVVFAGAGENIAGRMRYLHPTMYLPLFFGWVCLSSLLFRRFPVLQIAKQRTVMKATAMSVLLVGFGALPKMIDLAKEPRLGMFDAPFFACLQETAQRRKLRAGVASFLSDHIIAVASIDKGLGIERMARIGNLRRLGLGERGSLYVSQDTTNRYYEQGDFDFAVVNAHQGTVHLSLWPNENSVCADEGRLSCIEPAAYGFIIDGQAVEDEFGKPAEIVDCGPAALYLYDKPFNLGELLRG